MHTCDQRPDRANETRPLPQAVLTGNRGPILPSGIAIQRLGIAIPTSRIAIPKLGIVILSLWIAIPAFGIAILAFGIVILTFGIAILAFRIAIPSLWIAIPKRSNALPSHRPTHFGGKIADSPARPTFCATRRQLRRPVSPVCNRTVVDRRAVPAIFTSNARYLLCYASASKSELSRRLRSTGQLTDEP